MGTLTSAATRDRIEKSSLFEEGSQCSNVMPRITGILTLPYSRGQEQSETSVCRTDDVDLLMN